MADLLLKILGSIPTYLLPYTLSSPYTTDQGNTDYGGDMVR